MSLLRTIFLFFLLLLAFGLFAQKEKSFDTDTLFVDIMRQPHTQEQVDKLIELNKKAHYDRPDILEKALEIAEQIYYIDGIAKAFDQKGYTARKNNRFLKAIEYHKRALGFFEKTRDTFAKIKCLNNLGVACRKINNEKEAYKYYIRALDLAKKTHNQGQIARIYNGVGNVFVNAEEYPKAMFYFNKSLAIEKNNGNLKGQEYNMANIGEVFLLTKRFDSAEHYLKKSLDIAKIIYKDGHFGVEYNLLGKLYKDKGDYVRSVYYYQLAIPDLEKRNVKRYIANSLINMGLSQLFLGKKNIGYENILKGIAIAKEIQSKENISLGYNALVTYFEHTQNYREALAAHKLAKQFHDSIVNVTTKNGIISAQIIYETKEKDEKIKQLAYERQQEKKNSRRNLFITIATILISLVVIALFYVFFNLRRRNNDLELAQKNAEIQNYMMRIKDLEASASTNGNEKVDLKEKLKDLDLTKRETDVLMLISEGFSNDEIADKMYISKNTVKSHIKNIYLKLDVKNRVQVLKKIRNS